MDSVEQTFFRTVDEVAAAYLQPQLNCPHCHIKLRYDSKYRIIQCRNCHEIFNTTLNAASKKKSIEKYCQCPTCDTICCYIINNNDLIDNIIKIECCKCTLVFNCENNNHGTKSSINEEMLTKLKLNVKIIKSREIRSTRVYQAFIVKPWPPSNICCEKDEKNESKFESIENSDNENNNNDNVLDSPPRKKRRKLKSQKNKNKNKNGNNNENENSDNNNNKEKRLGDWRGLPSSGAPDRITRALNEKILLVSCENINNENDNNNNKIGKKFILLSTGNQLVSTIISNIPQCTCPDYKYGKLCKHIYFVYLKILHIPIECPLIWQKALLTNEINDMLYYITHGNESNNNNHNNNNNSDILADSIIRREYNQLIGKNTKKTERKSIEIQKQCPICYQNLISTNSNDNNSNDNDDSIDDTTIVWCESICGTNYHKYCIDTWAKVSKNPHCPLCRAPWKQQKIKKGGKFYKSLIEKSNHD